MSVSCTISETLSVISKNLKRSRDPDGRAPPYLSDCCVAVTAADTRRQLRSANRYMLAEPRVTGSTLASVGLFQLPAQRSGTLSRISPGTRPAVQTVSYVYLRCFVRWILVHHAH